MSVLILGPNKTNGLIIKEALEVWGCKARACLSYNEALGAMETESSFDMMIIDAAFIKDAHGYDRLMTKARNDDRIIPIVMMNSIFEMNSGVNVDSGVVMSTLLKPVRVKELRQIVADISIN